MNQEIIKKDSDNVAVIHESERLVFKHFTDIARSLITKQMEKKQADAMWKDFQYPVPVQYGREINLQAALLLLFKFDHEN